MASVLAKEEVWPARKSGLLPSVRPVTTLLATGIVWITGLLVACSIAAGYLRQQVLNTTADELRRLDTVLAEATARSLQGIDPVLASLADRMRRQSDPATVLQQAIDQSRQFDAIALIGADGKVLRAVGRWPTDLVDIAANKFFAGPAGSTALVGTPLEDAGANTFRLPVALRITGDQGAPTGAIVGMVPLTNLTRNFEAVPLAENTAITLFGADGRVLARYPQQPGRTGSGIRRRIFGGFRRHQRHDAASDRLGSAGMADRGDPTARRLSARPLDQPRRRLGSCRLDASGIRGRILRHRGRHRDRGHDVSDRPANPRS
jgi:hypothetical protein